MGWPKRERGDVMYYCDQALRLLDNDHFGMRMDDKFFLSTQDEDGIEGEVQKLLAEVQTDVLVMYGEHSHFTSEEQAQATVSMADNARSINCIAYDGDHWLAPDQYETFNEILNQFLAEVQQV